MVAEQRGRDDVHRRRYLLEETQLRVELTNAAREVLKSLGYVQ